MRFKIKKYTYKYFIVVIVSNSTKNRRAQNTQRWALDQATYTEYQKNASCTVHTLVLSLLPLNCHRNTAHNVRVVQSIPVFLESHQWMKSRMKEVNFPKEASVLCGRKQLALQSEAPAACLTLSKCNTVLYCLNKLY